MTLFIADKNRVSLLLQRKDKNTLKGLCYKKDWTWTEKDFKKKKKRLINENQLKIIKKKINFFKKNDIKMK